MLKDTLASVEIVAGEAGLEPRLGGSARSVAAVVHACHEKTIDDGLADACHPGPRPGEPRADPHLLRRAALRGGPRHLPGLQAAHRGPGASQTLDDFIARHKEIVVGDGSVRLVGQGETDDPRPVARRAREDVVGRELLVLGPPRAAQAASRHPARAHYGRSAVAAPGQTPAVILMEPQLADNIGMVARAMANFGLDELRLVAPRDGWPNEKARIAASGANYIIDDARASPTLDAALGDLNWIVATTARQRPSKKPVLTPEEAVAEMRRRIAPRRTLRHSLRPRAQRTRDERGRQRRRPRHDPGQLPLRLPQPGAGRVDSRLLLDARKRNGEPGPGHKLRNSVTAGSQSWCATARRRRRNSFGFFEHLEAELDRLGFFNPAHKRPAVVQNLRTMFSRMTADGAGSPHPSWHCCNAGKRQRSRPQTVHMSRHDVAKFSAERCPQTRHSLRNRAVPPGGGWGDRVHTRTTVERSRGRMMRTMIMATRTWMRAAALAAAMLPRRERPCRAG